MSIRRNLEAPPERSRAHPADGTTPPRRRIALLGPAVSIHLQRWAHAFVERGHAVCLISQHPCDSEALPEAAERVWLPHPGERGYLLNVPALRRALARWRPDLLNVHYASGYGTTAAFAGAVPTLLSVWGSDVYDFPLQSRLRGWLLRRNLRAATAIASTSAAMAEQVRRLTPERRTIALTPFGVDLDRFGPDPAGRDPAWTTIGVVKTLAPKYGIDLLLRAYAELAVRPSVRSLVRPARLVIVGEGAARAGLEALAADLRIAGSVRFVGPVPHREVPTWLNRFDVVAAPSRLDSESFGVAVVEASACGLPVVVSDAGGLPEVVRDGVTGLVVPRENVGALADALERLVLDQALRERLGSAGRAHAAAAYAWPRCIDRMEAACEGAIAAAGR